MFGLCSRLVQYRMHIHAADSMTLCLVHVSRSCVSCEIIIIALPLHVRSGSPTIMREALLVHCMPQSSNRYYWICTRTLSLSCELVLSDSPIVSHIGYPVCLLAAYRFVEQFMTQARAHTQKKAPHPSSIGEAARAKFQKRLESALLVAISKHRPTTPGTYVFIYRC